MMGINRKTAQHGNAKAANFKQIQRYFIPRLAWIATFLFCVGRTLA